MQDAVQDLQGDQKGFLSGILSVTEEECRLKRLENISANTI